MASGIGWPPASAWPQPSRGLSLLTDEAADYERTLTKPQELPDAQAERERKRVLIRTAMERFRIVAEAEAAQRAREVDDLKFDRALPEDQWPESVRKARAGGISPNGTVVSERPCLVINKLDQPVQQVISEARNAKLAITVKPKGATASKEGAQLRQGMIRAIETDSRANLARIWALERAVKCGRGFYRVLKTYANDGDFDMDLVIASIRNQGCVYLDPAAQEPDWSDGEFAFITDDMPMSEYRRRYGDTTLASASQEELQSISDTAPQGWVSTGEQGSVRVAEYFYVEYVPRILYQDPVSGENVLLDEGAVVPPGVLVQRPVEQRRVKWAVITATEVLDEEDWDGRYIPIIPVIGKQYVVDGTSLFKGVISNAKDSQRLYNYAVSSEALRAGLESLAPWVMAEGQDEGYEEMWDQANTRAFTRLKYKPSTFEGHLLPPPQRNDLASTNLSTALVLARQADGDIQATTGRFAPSLGKQDSSRSGKAIAQLKQQGELGSSNYLQNLANISMVHEGRILLDLLPHVYDRPGRIVRLLGEDPKDERAVLLHEPMIESPTGPQSAAPNAPGLIRSLLTRMQRGQTPAPAKTYKLEKSDDYAVVVSVGQSFQTQRDANAAMLSGIMQSAPNLTPMLVDLYIEQVDNVLSERVVKRLRRVNPQLNDEDTEQPQVPPQVQQQMQQMQQQLRAMQAELQKARSGVEVEQLRIQGDIQLKQLELASRERIEAAKIQAHVTETHAQIGSREGIETMKAETSRLGQVDDQMHETRMAHLEAEQDDRASVRDHHLATRAAVRDASLRPVPVPPSSGAGARPPANSPPFVPPPDMGV